MRATTAAIVILLLFGTAALRLPSPAPAPSAAPERVRVNDNRVPAGTLRGGILTVRLEVRQGEWHPDGDTETGVEVRAFAEEGKALQNPGPLIRTTEGTEVRVSIRNPNADVPLIVHGLHARGATTGPDTMHVPANGTREVRFVAGTPGTYYYWASTVDVPQLNLRIGRDNQLNGALVIDPRVGASARRDRIFVIALWTAEPVAALLPVNTLSRLVINGKAWPNTERLEYTAGDSIRWRVINASSLVHPMHLHGFYFRVTSRGDEKSDTVFAPGSPPRMAVTERMGPYQTMSIVWVPVRPGNWLFHCHDNVHIDRNAPLSGAPPVVPTAHHSEDPLKMMGGLVMGVHVRPRGSMRVTSEPPAVRRLRLVVRVDTGGTEREPSYGFALEERERPVSPAPLLPAPTIVLKRGDPVSITVVNELPEATAIHWHGIELQSYFDGVAAFAGQPGRVAPAIAPRDSFEVRFTPPRAGTFMYHTHMEEIRQQKAGLSGVLVVVEPTATFDPATDLVFLITTPRLAADAAVVYLNGSASPPPLEMQAGKRYRIRVVNLHTSRPSMRVEVKKDSAVVAWRAVAKDGADLPSALATERRASLQIGNGEAYDFEFVPATAGDMRITVSSGVGVLLATMPIRVR